MRNTKALLLYRVGEPGDDGEPWRDIVAVFTIDLSGESYRMEQYKKADTKSIPGFKYETETIEIDPIHRLEMERMIGKTELDKLKAIKTIIKDWNYVTTEEHIQEIEKILGANNE